MKITSYQKSYLWSAIYALILCAGFSNPGGVARAEKSEPQTDAKGKKIIFPEIEVTAPTIVAPNEIFSILYRTRPATPVKMHPDITVESKNGENIQKSSIELIGTEVTGSWGKKACALKVPGDYRINLRFSQQDASSTTKSISVKVLSSSEQEQIIGATPWVLPEDGIYLSPDALTKWSDIPEVQREQIALKRKTFTPLLPVPGNENEWWLTEAWNEISSIFQLQWLPERNMLNAFENAARSSRDRVAYAAYERNNCRIIFQSEIGKQSWIYIEHPAKTTLSQNALQVENILPKSLLLQARGQTNTAGSTAFISRTFSRYRALQADGPTEHVRVLLIHIIQPSQINLQMSSYE